VLSGAPISAAEAARIGLVTRVVDDIAAETEACVARLAGKSRAVLALARRALRHGRDEGFREARRAQRANLPRRPRGDRGHRGGRACLLEKRRPRWQRRLRLRTMGTTGRARAEFTSASARGGVGGCDAAPPAQYRARAEFISASARGVQGVRRSTPLFNTDVR
jgi:hypothetical protein